MIKPIETFCPTCFALPDPRDSIFHTRRQEQYFAYEIKRYNDDEEIQAEAERLIRRSTVLIDVPLEERIEPNWQWRICGQYSGYQNVFEILERLLNRYMLPYFWTHIEEGGERFEIARRLVIRLLEAFLEAHTQVSPDAVTDQEEWRVALGATPKAIFTPVDMSTDHTNVTCAICNSSASSEEPGYGPGAAVKTSCGHVFHQGCLETSVLYSINCPLCRSEICGPLQPLPDFDQSYEMPGWLYDLIQQSQPESSVEKPTEEEVIALEARRNRLFRVLQKSYNILQTMQGPVIGLSAYIEQMEEDDTQLSNQTNKRMLENYGRKILKETARGREAARRRHGDIFTARQRLSKFLERRCNAQQNYDNALDLFIDAEQAFLDAQRLSGV
jgi:hypothetical protein